MGDTIWKYPIEVGISEIMLPERAEFLHFGVQGTQLTVWVRLNPKEPKVLRTVRIYGTGFNAVAGKYIGTCEARGYIWHLFEQE